MAYPVIIRHHNGGFQSYLVLDDNPRELLYHPGFQEEYSVRPWLGFTDPEVARLEWAEMLGEDPDNYVIADDEQRDFHTERHFWDGIRMWPPRPKE